MAIYGKLASYLWKVTEFAIFPGVRVDCTTKKEVCFRKNENRNFASWNNAQTMHDWYNANKLCMRERCLNSHSLRRILDIFVVKNGGIPRESNNLNDSFNRVASWAVQIVFKTWREIFSLFWGNQIHTQGTYFTSPKPSLLLWTAVVLGTFRLLVVTIFKGTHTC